MLKANIVPIRWDRSSKTGCRGVSVRCGTFPLGYKMTTLLLPQLFVTACMAGRHHNHASRLTNQKTTVDSHETCAGSFDNQTDRYPSPIEPANSVWKGTAATDKAALHLDAVLCMHERSLHAIQHQVTLHICWKIY